MLDVRVCTLYTFSLAGHIPARLSTAEAGFGTVLTMFMIMFFAFGAASFTNFCTQLTDLASKGAVS